MGFPEFPVTRYRGTAVLVATVLLLLLFLTTGCATYTDKFKNLKPQLARGEFDKALETVEEESGSKDRLLYYLERGLILHYSDRFGFTRAFLAETGVSPGEFRKQCQPVSASS